MNRNPDSVDSTNFISPEGVSESGFPITINSSGAFATKLHYKNKEQSMIDHDMRDRLARAEQNIQNAKDNFVSFKADDFAGLKREVHTMRGELNEKLDILVEKISSIHVVMAKWTGTLGVIIFLGKFIMDKFLL